MRHLLDRHAALVLGPGVATAAAVAVTDRERTLTARSYAASDEALDGVCRRAIFSGTPYYRAFTPVNLDG